MIGSCGLHQRLGGAGTGVVILILIDHFNQKCAIFDLGEFLMGSRTCQLLSSCWSQLLPTEDQLGLQCCASCQQEKNDLPSKKLLVCGKCHEARYCSVSCQKAHWTTHKINCALLKGCLAQFNQVHKFYLAQLQHFAGQFDKFIGAVGSELAEITARYPRAREQQIMGTYTEYITHFFLALQP